MGTADYTAGHRVDDTVGHRIAEVAPSTESYDFQQETGTGRADCSKHSRHCSIRLHRRVSLSHPRTDTLAQTDQHDRQHFPASKDPPDKDSSHSLFPQRTKYTVQTT